MEDWEKIIDTLDDDVEEEFVDDWFCVECDHGPMGEADDECSRCGEPHPTLKKKTPVMKTVGVRRLRKWRKSISV